MRLGVKQVLTVVKIVDFGVYLGSDEERVLLPKKQVPEGIEVGDPIEVFLYKDSSDRMMAEWGRFLTGDWRKICSFHLKSRQRKWKKGINVL